MERVGGYELVRLLGQGGMGTVYEGRDPRNGERVAVKLLVSGREASAAQRTRFRREARALARLEHRALARLLDAGEERGLPYLVLPFYEGGSLEERLARGEVLAVEEAVRLGVELAEALEAAHGAGLLHRDVKPANVLFAADGQPVLTDFGLVKALARAGETERLTRSGTLQGTPGYWAPEQARGELTKVGPGTDVYGLGATLYAALAGRPPFEGESLVEVLRKTVEANPPSLRSTCPTFRGRWSGSSCAAWERKPPRAGRAPGSSRRPCEEFSRAR